MRPLLRIIALLFFITCSLSLRAQVDLKVDTIFGWPDTAIEGQTYFITSRVINTGQTPYNGTLQVGFQTLNPAGTIGLLYFNSLPIQVLPGDSILLSPNNGFVFDSTYFRPGNNVVVVWPIAQSAANIDTLHTDVFFQTISGLAAPISGNLLLSPVPAREYLHVRTINEMQIEHVRIFDVSGREYPVSSQPADRGGREIYLGDLPSGQYILETIFRNGPPARERFMRLK